MNYDNKSLYCIVLITVPNTLRKSLFVISQVLDSRQFTSDVEQNIFDKYLIKYETRITLTSLVKLSRKVILLI